MMPRSISLASAASWMSSARRDVRSIQYPVSCVRDARAMSASVGSRISSSSGAGSTRTRCSRSVSMRSSRARSISTAPASTMLNVCRGRLGGTVSPRSSSSSNRMISSANVNMLYKSVSVLAQSRSTWSDGRSTRNWSARLESPWIRSRPTWERCATLGAARPSRTSRSFAVVNILPVLWTATPADNA